MLFGVSRSLSPFCLSALPTGGDDGNRTHDPLLAGQVLSQLSYTPIFLNEVLIELTYGHSKSNNKRYLLSLSALSRRLFGFGLLLNYKSSATRSL